MTFGQIVIGPPGSGKTTYCHKISETYKLLGRKVSIINIDPANENLPYEADVDISDLINLSDVMDQLNLGPNGGMIYCMEYLEKNLDWLIEQLNQLQETYLIFDFPGQVELFTHHESVKKIIEALVKLNYRLCAVNLVDAHHCTDASKYISVLLLSLKTMIQLELPHLNVLSKIDLIESYGKLTFNLDFYTEVQDLSYLLDSLNKDPSSSKYNKLNKAIVDLIEDFSLVSFLPFCVDDQDLMLKLIRNIDKANGYIFGGLEIGNESLFEVSNKVDNEMQIMDVAERYLKVRKNEIRERKLERGEDVETDEEEEIEYSEEVDQDAEEFSEEDLIKHLRK
ncbi:GPN-loop GTPase 2 [Clydaea vesicula]|uniref:GPN-loop GTPase 2 n=1 Tax=Clydaea vesicula TaxID=447962 RepID=A0AAD5U2I7_9FUNG|nr:GPN-loop GTPase 2 [Clydaea vesicula]KAJ3379478.1 GPN-loop GTPase 2 [Lobulomyces angularis]